MTGKTLNKQSRYETETLGMRGNGSQKPKMKITSKTQAYNKRKIPQKDQKVQWTKKKRETDLWNPLPSILTTIQAFGSNASGCSNCLTYSYLDENRQQNPSRRQSQELRLQDSMIYFELAMFVYWFLCIVEWHRGLDAGSVEYAMRFDARWMWLVTRAGFVVE